MFLVKTYPDEDFSAIFDLDALNTLPPQDLQLLVFGLRGTASQERIQLLIDLLNERSGRDSYTYDYGNGLISSVNALGNKTTFVYDSDGRLVTVENEDGVQYIVSYEK